MPPDLLRQLLQWRSTPACIERNHSFANAQLAHDHGVGIFINKCADQLALEAVTVASDAASYITGTALLVDGGWTAIDGAPSGLTQTDSAERQG